MCDLCVDCNVQACFHRACVLNFPLVVTHTLHINIHSWSKIIVLFCLESCDCFRVESTKTQIGCGHLSSCGQASMRFSSTKWSSPASCPTGGPRVHPSRSRLSAATLQNHAPFAFLLCLSLFGLRHLADFVSLFQLVNI